MRRIIALILATVLLFCVAYAKELQQGSKGDEVAALQERLIELGYLDDTADGVYGKHTKDAVSAFQADSGIEATGIADLDTQNAIFDIHTEPDYILNTNTKKFHYPSCDSVDDMKDENKEEFYGTRAEAIAQGYDPCGRCKP